MSKPRRIYSVIQGARAQPRMHGASFLSAPLSLSRSVLNGEIVHNTLYLNHNREIAKTSKNVERANKTRERSVIPKTKDHSFSGYRFFPDLSLSESETTCINLHSGRFLAKCTENISRYLRLKQKTSKRAVNRQPGFRAGGS